MNTGAQRVFLNGDQGLYRSDDGGATWRRMAADDPRIVSRGLHVRRLGRPEEPPHR